MSTGMSVKRNIGIVVKSEKKSGGIGYAMIALCAGIVTFVLGTMYNFTPALLLGFFAFTSSFLYLNTMFWAEVYKNKGYPMSRVSRIIKM